MRYSLERAQNTLRKIQRFKNCNVLNFLGEGGFGSVYRVEVDPGWVFSGQISAVKLVELDGYINISDIDREAHILSRLEHPNIVKFKGVYTARSGNKTIVAIEMECIDGMPLTKYARSQEFDLSKLKACMKEICEAVSYIHSRHIVHEDLKGDNVMVTSAGSVKIIDFGIAKVFKSCYYVYGTADIGGTPCFLSPEKINYWMNCGTGLHDASGRYGRKADIFAIGCIVYELCEGTPPNEGYSTDDLLNKRRDMQRAMPQITTCRDENLLDFYKRATEKNADKRASMNELQNHPFLRDTGCQIL